MIHSRHNAFRVKGARNAFTLIELLVVLGIIGLLAAILFPAFRRAQESGAQANCASNLKQIYQAVELYRQDEKFYPSSLAFLLPKDFSLDGGNNDEGTGFFKGGRDALICPDDDTDASLIRSSYGDISTSITGGSTENMSRYLWNYWGYRAVDNTAKCTATDASECAGTAYQANDTAYVAQFQTDARFFTDPASPFDLSTNPVALTKLPRLANRFAPTSTIITHCVYHRLPTAGGKISGPYQVTDPSGAGGLARDIVLRRDGSAKPLDISKFHDATSGLWAKQNF